MFIQSLEELLYHSWRVGSRDSGLLESLEREYRFLIQETWAGREVEKLRLDIEYLWEQHALDYPVPLARTARRVDRELRMLRNPSA